MFRPQSNISRQQLTQFDRLNQAIINEDIKSLASIFQNESVEVQKVQSNGMTLFQMAVFLNKYTAAEWLLAHRATVAEHDGKGFTALHLMVYEGKYEAAKWLLEHGATVTQCNIYRSTLLQLMLFGNKYKAAKWLLTHGATVMERDADGRTALQLMLLGDKYDAAEWLLKHGATVMERDANGFTMLQLMVFSGKYRAAKWLLKRGAELTKYDPHGLTPLQVALFVGNYKAAEWLLAHGATVMERDADGRTALQLMVLIGEDEAAKWLQERGAKLEEKSASGMNLRNIARARDNLEAMARLNNKAVSNTTVIDLQNDNNHTISNPEKFDALAELERLVLSDDSDDDDQQDKFKELITAMRRGEASLELIFRTKKVDLQAKVKGGMTLFQLAVLEHKYGAAECLLKHGAKIEEKSADNRTVMELATAENNFEAIEWLKNKNTTRAYKYSGQNIETNNNNNNEAFNAAQLKQIEVSSIAPSSSNLTSSMLSSAAILNRPQAKLELEEELKKLEALIKMRREELQSLDNLKDENEKIILNQRNVMEKESAQYRQSINDAILQLEEKQKTLIQENSQWEASSNRLKKDQQNMLKELSKLNLRKEEVESQLSNLNAELTQIRNQLNLSNLAKNAWQELKKREEILKLEKEKLELEKQELAKQKDILWKLKEDYEKDRKNLQQQSKKIAWKEKHLEKESERLKLLKEKCIEASREVEEAKKTLNNIARERQQWMDKEATAEKNLQQALEKQQIIQKNYDVLESSSNKANNQQNLDNNNYIETSEVLELNLYKTGAPKIAEAIEDALILADDLPESVYKNQFLQFIDGYKTQFHNLQKSIEENQPKKMFLTKIKSDVHHLYDQLEKRISRFSTSSQEDKQEAIMLNSIKEEWQRVFPSLKPQSPSKSKMNSEPIEIIQTKKCVMAACYQAKAKKLAEIFIDIPIIFVSHDWSNAAIAQLVRRSTADLKNCGPSIIVDVWQNTVGTGVPAFIDKIADEKAVNCILLMGSTNWVDQRRIERDLICKRYDDNSQCIIPVLLCGDAKTAFPVFLQGAKIDAQFPEPKSYNLEDEYQYYEALIKIITRLTEIAFPGNRFLSRRQQIAVICQELSKELRYVQSDKLSSTALLQLYEQYQRNIIEEEQQIAAEIMMNARDYKPKVGSYVDMTKAMGGVNTSTTHTPEVTGQELNQNKNNIKDRRKISERINQFEKNITHNTYKTFQM